MRTTTAWALLLGIAALVSAWSEVNQQAVDDVASGKLKEAKASWWGFDAIDATACLQAALDSGVPKLTVDNVGQPWVVEPIQLASNQEILFEKGVEIAAKQGAFLGGNDSLFSARNKENITIRGYGATWRMHRDDYAAPPYKKAEWRHSLQLMSSTNVQVFGLHLLESGGDGVYLGTGKQWVTNKDIVLKDLICDRQYRQGISVITAENLLIENVVMRDTAGTAPQAGIDFEPNHPEERLVNVTMRNCVSENNGSWGYVLYLPPLSAATEPVSLRFENCKAIGNTGGSFGLVTDNTVDEAVKGTMEVVNCQFEGSKGPGILVTNNPPTGIRTRFENCTVSECNTGSPAAGPIVLGNRAGADQDTGGVEFKDCVVLDSLKRAPMSFLDMVGGLKASEVTGNLILEQDGQRTDVKLTEEVLKEWMPVLALKSFPKYDLATASFVPVAPNADPSRYAMPALGLRTVANAVLYAAGGETVRLAVRQVQVGKYAGTVMPVVVTGPEGAEVAEVEAPFEGDTTVEFTAPTTGLYRVKATPAANQMRFVTSSHPLSLSAGKQSVHFISATGEVFLYVPKGTTEFGIRVSGEGLGEGVKAALCDPAGTVVEEKDNIAQTYVLSATLDAPSPGEIWSLRLARPSGMAMEDFYVTPLGVPPLLAPSKEAVLKPE
ncbi:MAG: hypothetical protein COZ06_24685 [Armatimonadetes bacterium CG_4_10_14_3_um_filter_66_18]|nr:right-handed parallel beta-helix repeat-containing protein [Armatimonadota bacterium]OIP00702.1 MAG: hypothetical protein AUJ96_18400 [Armatimonadetes bacterium CG2_30_66_41]PIU89871.1 MAG: hypothetical protein COS65_27020 [Armatimonadetes bacterium CG06_land_8_20_14_3_00_66_21]PIY42686.1 MAG: hypothetical protein COZ06_24685 [Armatimonadetes bacterium CG_4_10_14_3_um_filter_66_18]PIZ47621.1 MAG: hypothetical protein COY42_08195 [Armatimonadetes bacterium CG_4_10_14_0_8_um_filter_66_14]PJB7